MNRVRTKPTRKEILKETAKVVRKQFEYCYKVLGIKDSRELTKSRKTNI